MWIKTRGISSLICHQISSLKHNKIISNNILRIINHCQKECKQEVWRGVNIEITHIEIINLKNDINISIEAFVAFEKFKPLVF